MDRCVTTTSTAISKDHYIITDSKFSGRSGKIELFSADSVVFSSLNLYREIPWLLNT